MNNKLFLLYDTSYKNGNALPRSASQTRTEVGAENDNEAARLLRHTFNDDRLIVGKEGTMIGSQGRWVPSRIYNFVGPAHLESQQVHALPQEMTCIGTAPFAGIAHADLESFSGKASACLSTERFTSRGFVRISVSNRSSHKELLF